MGDSVMDARLLPYAFARDFALLAQRNGAADGPVEVWISDATTPSAIAEVSRCFGRIRLKVDAARRARSSDRESLCRFRRRCGTGHR